MGDRTRRRVRCCRRRSRPDDSGRRRFDGQKINFGYGLGITNLNQFLGHDGAIFGYSSVVLTRPETDTQIAFVANESTNFTTPTLNVAVAIIRGVVSRSVALSESSALVRERVVLVADDPPIVLAAESDGQPQPVLRVLRQLVGRSAAQQRVRERHVASGRHLQRLDLEDRTLSLPGEERRPGVAVGVEAADALVRRRDVEHDDVGGVILEDRVQVTVVDGRRPPLDEPSDRLLRRHS